MYKDQLINSILFALDLKPTPEDEKIFLDSIQRKATIAYNQKAYKWKAVNYDNTNSIVYLLARVAQDYASLVRVFQEIKKRQPGFKPQSLFDFGSGVGSVIWYTHILFYIFNFANHQFFPTGQQSHHGKSILKKSFVLTHLSA